MNKKMVMIVAIVLGCIVLVLGIWFVLSNWFGIGPAFPGTGMVELDTDSLQYIPDYQVGEQGKTELIAMVQTEQEAKEVAEQYGITFVSFDTGVAVFETDEDPMEVISRGEKNGYVPLSLNYIRTIDDFNIEEYDNN